MSVVWDSTTRQFIRDGKPIPPASIREFILETVNNAKTRIESIAESYLEHRNTAEWFLEMKDELRNMHTALAMVAQGGRDQMDASSWAQVGNQIKSEMGYLRGFERDIANGNVSDAQLLARAIQYGEAGWVTYQRALFNREREAGTAYIQWQLDDGAEHCEGCIASEGVHPIDDAPELGSNECGGRCRCWYDVVDAEAA